MERDKRPYWYLTHIDKDWAMKNNPQLASASHKGNMRERTYDMALNDYPLFVDTLAPKVSKENIEILPCLLYT